MSSYATLIYHGSDDSEGVERAMTAILSPRAVYQIVDDAIALMKGKAADYSSPTDAHSNFHYANDVARPFPAEYKSYAVLIGVKLARLSQLLQPSREVMNESVRDSFLDLINYCALMAERYTVEQSASGVKLVDQAPGVWIDVSETLPLDDEVVLVWDGEGMYVSGRLRRYIEEHGSEGAQVKWMHLPMAPAMASQEK